jgi:Mg2+ and Co2+ transporter CorA
MDKKTEKYYKLLDKLADAIKNDKSAIVIEGIKDKIEDIEHEVYMQQMKGKKDE